MSNVDLPALGRPMMETKPERNAIVPYYAPFAAFAFPSATLLAYESRRMESSVCRVVGDVFLRVDGIGATTAEISFD